MLSFGEAVRAFYRRYVDFKGRSQRSEYWWVQLYVFTCYVIFAVLIFMGAGGVEGIDAMVNEENFDQFGPVAILGLLGLLIFVVANIIPNIAIQVRRFHDLNQTGWLVLAFGIGGQIPLVGIFVALGNIVWFMIKGTDGANKYGHDPLNNQVDVFE